MNHHTLLTLHLMNFQITYTINQLLFEATLIHNSTEINWFAANYFRNKALPTSVLSKQPYANNWLVARIIHNDKALANLAKISCTQIKVSLLSDVLQNNFYI